MEVAGQIGFDQASSFVDRGTIIAGNDFNQIVIPGVYRISGSSANSPVDYGTLLVFKTSSILQLCIRSSSASFYYRVRWNNEWSGWQRADNFGCNTLAELASGIEPLLPVKGISLSLTLEAGSKIDTEMSKNGIYYIYSTTFGKSAMFTMGATKLDSDSAFLSSSDVNPFTYDLDGNNLIGINREASYGNIFIKNNRTTSVDIRLLYMSYY